MIDSNLIIQKELLHKGAEANLYEGYWFGKKVIFKHRIKKIYREESLDYSIRTTRTLNEGRALIKLKEEGINVPQVFEIDTEKALIIMKYITEKNQIFFIDFGLHEYSDSIEDKSVDIHLFKRVLVSTHGIDFKPCFDAFLEGYRSIYKTIEKDESKLIIKNISAIERRGRYVKRDTNKFE
jgi:TP53 regulating kinase-like protein